jgi:1-acyl-sn-glycerol-3-phosphate acyltransferase
MPLLRRLIRIPLLTLHVLSGLLIVLFGFPRRRSEPLGPRRRAIVRAWHRGVLRIFGVRLSIEGEATDEPALYVSNHVSWTDIPIIGALSDVTFLSKDEVARWPVVGTLATRSGTLYIRRGGKNAANEASDVITFSLIRGQSVLVFPEGTTTRGESVRRFHPRLFAAAQLAERLVQPVTLRYLDADGRHDPDAAWVGDDPLGPHLWRLLGRRRNPVAVTFGPALSARGSERRALAEQAHARVAAALERPLARAGSSGG